MNSEPNQSKQPREITNANLFSDDISFSDTEQILFSEDLQDGGIDQCPALMEGLPEKRYRLIRKLNEGGMKMIWEVEDRRTARTVAMAMIQKSRIASQDDINAFLYEARLTANLQHPSIIPIYDIALDESGNPYFTMKVLRGQTLAEVLEKLRKNDPNAKQQYSRTQLLNIMTRICDSMAYAHAKGVIHLDLKPENIILGKYGGVHVLDWGLSILMTRSDESLPKHPDVKDPLPRYLKELVKGRKVVGGTPGYMAPEQAQGSKEEVDFRTDIYMLGALLYEMLTGHCPIEEKEIRKALQMTVRGEIMPPSQRAPKQKIPAALNAIIQKAMNLDRTQRYPSVSALLYDLRQYQDGFATRAENPTFFRHLTLLIKRHKPAIALISASLVIITAVLINSFREITTSEREAHAARLVATRRLEILKEQKAYIDSTAKKVAPDYLTLMKKEEAEYRFNSAEEALNTSLAFDPSLAKARKAKAETLFSRLQFKAALEWLEDPKNQPPTPNDLLKKMAARYAAQQTQNQSLPQSQWIPLVKELQENKLTTILPRLFYHLNSQPLDTQDHLAFLDSALRITNPDAQNIKLSGSQRVNGAWDLTIGNDARIENITPLCGLRIEYLNLSGCGAPDLRPLTDPALKELSLSGTTYNHLFISETLKNLERLDISRTNIRNLTRLTSFPNLTQLDLSGIPNLQPPDHLLWNSNLRQLTVSASLRQDPTVQLLATRNVIIIYTRD